MVTIAIIGRPNVGKSTLFNRLVGKRLALVDDQPGVTRDRRPGDARLLDLKFEIVDTAGLEVAASDSLSGRMREQTEHAMRLADLSLFMVDVKTGIVPEDDEFAKVARRSGAKIVLVANKSEAKGTQGGFLDAYTLGLGDPVAISAEHGEGLGDLRDALVEALGIEAFGTEDDGEDDALTDVTLTDDSDEPLPIDLEKPLRIAIVGRPNAGKSTLVNRILGEERMLTGPEAGITRDSISVDWNWRGRKFKIFDTAGLRRKARVYEKLEKLSVADALRSLKFAEVVIVVLDSTIPFERQDLSIIDLIAREGRAPVIAFNKWDLIEDRQELTKELREKTDRLLPQVKGVRTVMLSGETGEGIDRLMKAVVDAHLTWNSRVSTARLNQWLERITAHHSPPAVAGRRVTIKYMTQVKTRPPTFMLSTSRPDAIGASYSRYLINGLKESFGLVGIPIRLGLRKPPNPYASKKKRPS